MPDEFFGYRFGKLEYRTVRFETEVLDMPDYQGNAVINYTEYEVPYTRIIEHKHFNFGTQPKTVISREYPAEYAEGMEAYYPVNDAKNSALMQRTRRARRCGRTSSSAEGWANTSITIWTKSSRAPSLCKRRAALTCETRYGHPPRAAYAARFFCLFPQNTKAAGVSSGADGAN